MKVNLEELSKLERRLNIEVPVETVRDAYERAYSRLQKDVVIKGFRKGRVPISNIRSMYKDHVGQDVVNDLVSRAYEKALDEKALHPIGEPSLKIQTFEPEKPFHFSLQFEIRPKVVLQQYVNLPVEKEIYSSEEENKVVEERLLSMAQREVSLVDLPENRPLQNGDVAIIDFEGFVDGSPLERGTASNHELKIGSQSFIPGFEEGLLGMNVGDRKELHLNFPVEYHQKSVAGKPVLFKVELKSVKLEQLPTLDDAFAKKLNCETLDDLKTRIRSFHEMSEKDRIEKELRERILSALVERNPVDIPNSILNEQKKLLVEGMKKKAHDENMGSEEIEDLIKKMDSNLEESASYMIRSSFLVDAIAGEQGISVSDSDVDAHLAGYSKSSGIPLSKIRTHYKDGNRRAQLRFKLVEERVVDFLISKALIREVGRELLKGK